MIRSVLLYTHRFACMGRLPQGSSGCRSAPNNAHSGLCGARFRLRRLCGSALSGRASPAVPMVIKKGMRGIRACPSANNEARAQPRRVASHLSQSGGSFFALGDNRWYRETHRAFEAFCQDEGELPLARPRVLEGQGCAPHAHPFVGIKINLFHKTEIFIFHPINS